MLTIPRSVHWQPGRLAGTLAATCGLANLLAAALPPRRASLGRPDVLVPGPLSSGPAVANLAVGLLLALAAGFWWRHPATIPVAGTALVVGVAWLFVLLTLARTSSALQGEGAATRPPPPGSQPTQAAPPPALAPATQGNPPRRTQQGR